MKEREREGEREGEREEVERGDREIGRELKRQERTQANSGTTFELSIGNSYRKWNNYEMLFILSLRAIVYVQGREVVHLIKLIKIAILLCPAMKEYKKIIKLTFWNY